jgi:hypothetical protein
MAFYKNPARNAGQPYADPNERYWADEEGQLRQRGIDPMQVEQMAPPKFPNAPGSTALHANGGLIGQPPTRTDHVNKSYQYADGGFLPSFVGSAAQSFNAGLNKKKKIPGTPASSIDDTDDYDTNT